MASLTDTASEADTEAKPPERSYQVIGAAKIPVSKHLGQIWKARRASAVRKREHLKLDKAWEEAVKYYDNDQLAQRDGTRHSDYGPSARGLVNRVILDYAETENVVFSNCNAAVPAIYSKNPECEITCSNTELEPLANISEALINALFNKKEAPGVNIKPKARRAIVSTFLTNQGWLEVGWVMRQDSTEQALQDLDKLTKELEKAKTTQEVIDAEGKLMALEQSFSMLSEAGPYVKYRPPYAVLRDPDSVEEDLSDAAWIIVEDVLSTAFLRAKYFREGSDESIYEPTHHVPTGGKEDAIREQINNFSIFDSSKAYTELGYGSQEEYDECKRTKVHWVWDKTTRRLYLFHDKQWAWPIWVWNDPYGLTTFFPVVPFSFYTSIKGGETKGEVTYYLDQQDAINFNNSVKHAIKAWAGTKIFYDTNMLKQSDAERLLQSNKLECLGINVPEGSKLEEVMPRGIPHPATNYAQLFDNVAQYQAIDRMSIVSDVQRGAQFKTNTTNEAIGQYNQTQQTKYDSINDQVEDSIGMVAYLVLQLCWKYMDATMVSSILGSKADGWRNLTDEEIKGMHCRVEGGSMQKPNSIGKQKQALELGQVLGQFAGASPAIVIVMLKIMERAFDDVVITPEDWELIAQSLQPEPQTSADPNAPPAEGAGGQPELPPEAQAAYDEMVAGGVPPEQAAQKIAEALQGQQ